MKQFYRVKVIFNKVIEAKEANWHGVTIYATRMMPGTVYAEEIDALGIAFKRALMAFPDKSEQFRHLQGVREVKLIQRPGVLPIPKNANLCAGCRIENDCNAIGHYEG
jgi:hypothetical protein